MPRFVILRHEMPPGRARGTHFDLMLEAGEALRTWSLPELPFDGKTISAEPLADHRLAYLDYEGPVSGDRGSVSRVEEGEYEMLVDEGRRMHLRVAGKVMSGTLELWQDSAGKWGVTYYAHFPAA